MGTTINLQEIARKITTIKRRERKKEIIIIIKLTIIITIIIIIIIINNSQELCMKYIYRVVCVDIRRNGRGGSWQENAYVLHAEALIIYL